MANWKREYSNAEKDLSSIGALFETGKIKRMYDIAELYPTKIVKLLGMNAERYAVKLANPEKFTVSEILRLAFLINVDPNLIIDVVQLESEKRLADKVEKQRERNK